MNAKAKIVLITGVSRGLGRALLERFAAEGHTVVGCARSAPAIASLQRDYRQPHDFSRVDVAVEAEVQAWAAQLLRSHGAPDLLLNNAAVINRNAALWKVPAREFDWVIDVNIKGVANVLRHFVPAMLVRRRGVIVNFSSGWGRSASAEVAPYCATKWAIEGMTQALAQELPAGMAAIPLNPGIINTEMLQSCFGHSASAHPSAEQWAQRAVSFLLQLGPKDNGQPLSVP